MSVSDQIKKKLEQALSPENLDVIDESDKHKGHMGARPEGETHFRVIIVSGQFEGMNRVGRQRLVNKALKEELEGPVHALAMSTLTPLEAQNQAD
jgi:BolA protein